MRAVLFGILVLVAPDILLSQEFDALQGYCAVEVGEWTDVDSNRIVSGPVIPPGLDEVACPCGQGVVVRPGRPVN